MADRGRACYALLRTWLAWIPAPSRHVPESAGFVTASRACLACKALGRVEASCKHCGGSGVRPVKDAMDDPDKNPNPDPRRLHAGWGGEGREHERDLIRERDKTIERLEANAQVRAGRTGLGDALTRAVEARDRLYAAGSYQELGLALEWLRGVDELAFRVCEGVACQPLCEEPVEPVRRVVVAACELLATRMPVRIRVPSWVDVYTAEELARQSREAKAALANGRSVWASATRRDRKLLIVTLHAEGMPDGKIAERFGLERHRVQQIRSGIEALLAFSASGDAPEPLRDTG